MIKWCRVSEGGFSLSSFYLSFFLTTSLCGSESPLTVAAQSGLAVEGIRVLVQGGAHLDFRSRDGLTAVHKAVRVHNHTGLLVRTLNKSCMHAQVIHYYTNLQSLD